MLPTVGSEARKNIQGSDAASKEEELAVCYARQSPSVASQASPGQFRLARNRWSLCAAKNR